MRCAVFRCSPLLYCKIADALLMRKSIGKAGI